MRFNEFTDPEPYSLFADDATDFLNQLLLTRSPENAAFVLGIKSQPLDKQRELSDAL